MSNIDDVRAWKSLVETIDGLVQRLRVHDFEAHQILGDILTELGGSAGTSYFNQAQTTTTGSLQTLLSVTVPASTTRKINKVIVVCSQPGKFTISYDSTIVGTGRTHAANKNVSFNFIPGRDATTGQVIKVEFDQSHGPVGEDVECYIMGTDTT